MAEYFMARGHDVLLVLDDLTKHAAAYRQVSLLLRRPPGREAYPGDIFYIHSRLLERAAKMAPERGGGSLTALPIAETQAGNISAYIPTNLISITDGQIYLDPRLFYEDQKPAVDVGKSVSRVGGKTQAPVLKALSESLRLEYAQFLELEVFTRFGTMVDERTRKVIEHGRRIRAVLGQPQFAPLSLGEEIALLCAVADGVLDPVPLDRMNEFRAGLAPRLAQHCPEIVALGDEANPLPDAVRTRLKQSLIALANRLAEGFPRRERDDPPSGNPEPYRQHGRIARHRGRHALARWHARAGIPACAPRHPQLRGVHGCCHWQRASPHAAARHGASEAESARPHCVHCRAWFCRQLQ
jgi:proton translocating ATP synthase F1 alpha subunit